MSSKKMKNVSCEYDRLNVFPDILEITRQMGSRSWCNELLIHSDVKHTVVLVHSKLQLCRVIQVIV